MSQNAMPPSPSGTAWAYCKQFAHHLRSWQSGQSLAKNGLAQEHLRFAVALHSRALRLIEPGISLPEAVERQALDGLRLEAGKEAELVSALYSELNKTLEPPAAAHYIAVVGVHEAAIKMLLLAREGFFLPPGHDGSVEALIRVYENVARQVADYQ